MKTYRQIEVDVAPFKKGWSCRVTYPSGAQKVVATHQPSEASAWAAGIRHAKDWYEIDDNTNELLWLVG